MVAAVFPGPYMARDQVDLTPLDRRDDLVNWIAQGVKPKSQFHIGTEHEKFVFTLEGHRPVPYEGQRGIRALLEGMQHLLGWQPIMEGPNIIGLFDVTGGGAISLEPGGQFELSGAQVKTIHQTSSELMAHLAQVREVAQPLHIGFLGLGMTPDWTRAEIPKMPKGRYKIMTAYMPKVGTRGLDMMYRTCTVQTNLDFSSEADMVKKLRVSIALQPVATALFANSPFTEGKPNGFLSFRSEIWRDTDNARAGMLPWVFEPGMGFERWVDYALDVPMYFVKRGDDYIDTSGQSFRDLLVGKLPAMPGERATLSDWANHLSTTFPEVRLSAISKCAVPIQVPCQISWHCRHCGSASSMMRSRSMRPGIWPRPGVRKSGRSCATTCRNKVSLRQSKAALFLRSRARFSSFRALASCGANISIWKARTRRAILRCWKIVSRAAPRRRRNCSRNIMVRGVVRSIRSILKRRIEEVSY
jgi:glutamate--cysteine ligase